ncbi:MULTISPECIES: hypothetical protein [Nostoc cyanobionts]|uniref:hypothetical protein n=1 Tax=Nostoc cyanobionts TaxID=3123326 RepID=UPI00117BEB01|nr:MULTISPECIES: hypothetical protein [unclassified Nostoc]
MDYNPLPVGVTDNLLRKILKVLAVKPVNKINKYSPFDIKNDIDDCLIEWHKERWALAESLFERAMLYSERSLLTRLNTKNYRFYQVFRIQFQTPQNPDQSTSHCFTRT